MSFLFLLYVNLDLNDDVSPPNIAPFVSNAVTMQFSLGSGLFLCTLFSSQTCLRQDKWTELCAFRRGSVVQI